jgi:cytochrome c peroxidase
MPPRLFAIVACCLTLISTIALRAQTAVATPSTEGGASVQQARDCGGEPCDAVVRGARAFFDRRLRGLEANGRSCADCHMVTDHFQLSPASVEARFRFLQWRRGWDPDADDPLFRPIDADDFRTNGENASDFSNLRKNGLIRVVLPLPLNVRLIDPATSQASGEVEADVWRSVPTVNDVKLTGSDGVNPWTRGPNRTGGYQMDARMATLQDQALGALVDHARIQRMPPQELLDDLAAFQRVLFTNHRVRALADAVTDGAPLPDPDPPLNELQQRGKLVFERACAHCHGGPGQSTTQAPVVRFHDINTQCPRPVDVVTPPRFAFAACAPGLERNARTYEITLANGTKTRRTSSDPGRALLTGFVGGPPPTDDWNKFDIPGLRGIRNTAPYFHNNSAATLEQVVDHYIEFFKRVRVNALPGIVPPVASTDGINFDRQPAVEERQALLAYLRKL